MLVFAFGTVLAFEEVLATAYAISQVITYRFNRKLNNSWFCHFTAAVLVSLRGTSTCVHTKPLSVNFGRNIFPNIKLTYEKLQISTSWHDYLCMGRFLALLLWPGAPLILSFRIAMGSTHVQSQYIQG